MCLIDGQTLQKMGEYGQTKKGTMEKEINVNELNTLLGTEQIVGVWLGDEYHKVGYGKAMVLVVEERDNIGEK